jgi:uncharacterized protein (DUF4415 family)
MPKLKPGTILPTQEEDAAITAAAESDPDARPFTDAEWESAAPTRRMGVRGPQKAPTKVLLSVRYSHEVVQYFKSTGDGWQARMDQVLKDYVAARR